MSEKLNRETILERTTYDSLADTDSGSDGIPSLEVARPPKILSERWLASGVCIFLATIIWLVFGQTLHHGFVAFDDNSYVYENAVVQKGLTWEGFRWALTYGEIGHWHPLTWLSHMLDCQLLGLQAGAHHGTNLILHGAAAVLLFLVLWQMTGFLWRSATVAAVFAIHPLRVESVAWVAERKDVLSAFFFMLTLGAYVYYVRRPTSLFRYGAVVLCFALGLLSKNMLVTLPCVLLLLDYWPLNRISTWTAKVVLRLVIEKIPLFLLTILSCVETAMVPEKIPAGYRLSLLLRLENALISYVTYLWQMIWPSGLACIYPNPTSHFPFWQVAGALGVLLIISWSVWVARKSRPYLVTGWLWYLGMMIPVIGVVQISYYSHADRYTYLPQIGVYWLLTWLVAEQSASWRGRRFLLGGASAVILGGLIIGARSQTAYWRDSESLWSHALACTSDNATAETGYGMMLIEKGKMDEAIVHLRKASAIVPDDPEFHFNLGNALVQKGEVDEAIARFRKAIDLKPDYSAAYSNLGSLLLKKGGVDEAIALFRKALQIKSDDMEAHYNLGSALFQKNGADEALLHFQAALQLKPESVEARYSLGNVLLVMGKIDEAIGHYQKILQMRPEFTDAVYNLGNALLQQGNVEEAITQYKRALELKPEFADVYNNFGNALAHGGRLDEAIAHYEKALQLRPEMAEAHNNLGNVLLQKGRYHEAIGHLEKVLVLKPDDAGAQNNLAWLLATSAQASLREGERAIKLAQRANQLTGGKDPNILETLAAAYAEAGRFGDALTSAKNAIELARTAQQPVLLKQLEAELTLYEDGQPFHEGNQTGN